MLGILRVNPSSYHLCVYITKFISAFLFDLLNSLLRPQCAEHSDTGRCIDRCVVDCAYTKHKE